MNLRRLLGALAPVGVLLAASAPAGAAPGNLPGGTSIDVTINAPANGALIASLSGVSLSGSASVGQGQPVANTTLVYALVVSGSTFAQAGTSNCGNPNGGNPNTILDCEIVAAKNLNAQAVTAGTVDEVGVAVFGSSAETGDVGPAGGIQLLTGPATDANSLGGRDLDEVLNSAQTGALNRFTPRSVGTNTDFVAGVQRACQVVQASSNPNNVVVFLSDGLNGGSTLGASLPCQPTGAVFHTFAVGQNASCTGGSGTTLQEIAQRTGGTCTHVVNVGSLPSIVPGLIASQLTKLELQIDGGAPTDISSAASAPLPQTGPTSITYATTVGALAPGSHSLCVIASGSDGGGAGSVNECRTVTVATLVLNPPTAVNELGTPATTHTVTATLAAGPAGGVSGETVSFSVTTGPNAGQAGSATTDGSGNASFTYPGIQGLSGIGTDTIEARWTDSQGTTLQATATKRWADTTPSAASCPAGTNPGGNVPSAGANPKSGQNPDGFYRLTATDAVDPNPQLFVLDTGSGTVFGPFAAGTEVKYVQAQGATPSQESIGGPGSSVGFKLTGTGDAAVYAVDTSGNRSANVACNVPAPPK